MVHLSDTSIRITPEAGIVWAILVLTVPLPWLIAWVLAAAVHELFHCIAVWLCGRHIEEIRIGAGGAEIRAYIQSDLESLLCSLAGPAGGMFVLLFTEALPRVALCAMIQTVFNLLPIYPLDGGRALRCFMSILFAEEIATKIHVFIETVVITVLLICAAILSMYGKLRMAPMIIVLLFLLRVKKIKIPCKWRFHRVQ